MYKRSFLLVSTLFLPFLTTCHEWTNPQPNVAISYVYAPAVLTTEILMGRYCPKFIASTGELITCHKGIEVLREPASSGNLAEINLKQERLPTGPKEPRRAGRRANKKESPKKIYPTEQSFLVRLIMVPFKALWYVASYLSNTVLGLSVKALPEKASAVSLKAYWIDPIKVNLAQEEDLRLFKTIYTTHNSRYMPEKSAQQHGIVLYGTSRGSATVFNFCALEKPKEVRAVICEGLFDSISHIYSATTSAKTRFMINLLRRVSNFDDDGILPIKLVHDIPLDMPMLLITSYKDKTVPWECTMNIYTQLRATGHHNIHILILKKAGHAWYPFCKKNERELYQSVVHAFYKHYGLPYIQEYADKGHTHFITMTQPAAALITECNTSGLKP